MKMTILMAVNVFSVRPTETNRPTLYTHEKKHSNTVDVHRRAVSGPTAGSQRQAKTSSTT